MSSNNSFVYDLNNNTDGSVRNKVTILNFGIFFDGTLNNKWNTAARKIAIGEEIAKSPAEAQKAKAAYAQLGNKKDDSFENDYTNVARLFQCAINDDYAIYMEGPGTATKEDQKTQQVIYRLDDQGGFGFGHGFTGVRAKVKMACEEVAKKISGAVRKEGNRNYDVEVILDVYGFSRGAAAARNFIHEVTRDDGIYALDCNADKQEYQKAQYTSCLSIPRSGFLGFYLKQEGLDLKTVNMTFTIRFAGIFDTVSSYEPKGEAGKVGAAVSHNFKNDTGELGLTAVSKADKVLHLTALDECRENFALTNIASAVKKKHIEIGLPGAHSDVGGSYVDGMREQVEVLDAGFCSMINKVVDPLGIFQRDKANRKVLAEEKAHLIEQGWFRNGECITDIKWDMFYELKFRRERLSNKYSYVPLHLMGRYILERWREEMWYMKRGAPVVIDKDRLHQDYPLFQGKPKALAPFSIEGRSIRFKVGQIECKIYKEERERPLMNLGAVMADNSPLRWRIVGNMNGRYDTWVECVHVLFNYVIANQGYLLSPNEEREALKFATATILTTPLPGKRFSFPKTINLELLLSPYRYQDPGGYNTVQEKQTFDWFAANVNKLNHVLEEQIYIRRLRNRYLHWSSTYARVSLYGTVAPYKPRIVNGKRKRNVIRG